MSLSVLDLFSIGLGPSSSHTVGPMRAARRFARELGDGGPLAGTAGVRAEFYGSLAATGVGHGSDTAVVLGLAGRDPETIGAREAPEVVREVEETGRLPSTAPTTSPSSASATWCCTRAAPCPATPTGCA